MSADPRPLTITDLLTMKAAGKRIVMLTCYDAVFARLLEEAGVDVLLVGDSLNQVIAGHETTLSATLDQIIYHAAAVRRGSRRALVFVDLPFLTYQVSIPEAIRNAGRVLQETGAQGIKLEGGSHMVDTVTALVDRANTPERSASCRARSRESRADLRDSNDRCADPGVRYRAACTLVFENTSICESWLIWRCVRMSPRARRRSARSREHPAPSGHCC